LACRPSKLPFLGESCLNLRRCKKLPENRDGLQKLGTKRVDVVYTWYPKPKFKNKDKKQRRQKWGYFWTECPGHEFRSTLMYIVDPERAKWIFVVCLKFEGVLV
jgi:hypothetical protein